MKDADKEYVMTIVFIAVIWILVAIVAHQVQDLKFRVKTIEQKMKRDDACSEVKPDYIDKDGVHYYGV